LAVPGEVMLEFENVSKSYWTGQRRKVILANASFHVHAGNSLGILAPNGTGKTTLINMMSGLEKPDEGSIRRYCKRLFPAGVHGRAVRKMTARENTRYIAELYGLDPDYVEAFCRWVCESRGILRDADQHLVRAWRRGCPSRCCSCWISTFT
jgi:capsular polysaccharide transport system ATP-binding protein